ncbi:uncharacterized protein ARMOST_21495 [Armillaria ostoyae]|uniref:Uncharacterized protein n=1 Tax=Armillaria ostoyae TaxID=47428 RepID=A0A284SAD6_ARMOS|nr:uncharacterized protein ARMOST_21495 [Armillaria ostoyae]
MYLLDLLQKLLSYVIQYIDADTLRPLCITEKDVLHHIARYFLWRNATVIFHTEQKSTPSLFSFDSGDLAAIRSLSIIVDRYFDFYLPSFASILASMINNMASLVTLELVRSVVEPQDYVSPDVIRICVSFLRPLTVEHLEVRGIFTANVFLSA